MLLTAHQYSNPGKTHLLKSGVQAVWIKTRSLVCEAFGLRAGKSPLFCPRGHLTAEEAFETAFDLTRSNSLWWKTSQQTPFIRPAPWQSRRVLSWTKGDGKAMITKPRSTLGDFCLIWILQQGDTGGGTLCGLRWRNVWKLAYWHPRSHIICHWTSPRKTGLLTGHHDRFLVSSESIYRRGRGPTVLVIWLSQHNGQKEHQTSFIGGSDGALSA